MSLHRKKKLRHFLIHSALHVFFVLLCFATLVPILYALSVSLNAENSLLSSDFRFIPKEFTLNNYKAVFTEQPVMLWFKNSMILAVCTVLISLGAAIPAAYVFSRKRFAGRGPILEILLLLYSFPSVLSMFAMTAAAEFSRILAPGGHFVQVLAGPDHLLGLKSIIYPELFHREKTVHPALPGFSLAHSETLEFSFALEGEAVQHLLYMTPHVYRISKAGAERLRQTTQLSDKAQVIFNLYSKE